MNNHRRPKQFREDRINTGPQAVMQDIPYYKEVRQPWTVDSLPRGPDIKRVIQQFVERSDKRTPLEAFEPVTRNSQEGEGTGARTRKWGWCKTFHGIEKEFS